MADNEHRAPEQRTVDVDVEAIDTRGRTLHGYAAVYNVESEDLGGFRERIAPGAFRNVLDADVRALLNHDPSQVLGRTKSGTLRLFDEQRGLRFEVDLPDSPLGENVREAVRRKDIDGASFRFAVDQESWQRDLRTIESVKHLREPWRRSVPIRRRAWSCGRETTRTAPRSARRNRTRWTRQGKPTRSARRSARRPVRCGWRTGPRTAMSASVRWPSCMPIAAL
jgi:HK97 family phage prohead protease